MSEKTLEQRVEALESIVKNFTEYADRFMTGLLNENQELRDRLSQYEARAPWENRAIAMRNEGMSNVAIAKEVGKSRPTIIKLFKQVDALVEGAEHKATEALALEFAREHPELSNPYQRLLKENK